MARVGLFDDLPDAPVAGEPGSGGRPRLREPVRDQVELRAMDLDSLIGADHPARTIWGYVERLDLSELEGAIKSREGRPGHPTITPRLMLALWLHATSQGVGSARVLARLCESEDGYRWLCGGVSVNHHTLGDFRVGQGALLDRLLAETVAALMAAGVVDLERLAQDGVRVRAAAGASSFRRRKTLEERLAAARALVDELKREVGDAPAASNKRARAARERGARERAERVEAALRELGEIEAARSKRAPKTGAKPGAPPGGDKPADEPKQPRASTTDPQARVMKMADGGFRPAYNVQVASAAGEQIVVAVEPVASGSDRGLMGRMLEEVGRRTGEMPGRWLADGGFVSAKDIEWAHGRDIAVYVPPLRSKHGTDPYAPRPDDGPGVAAWRQRMASQAGQSFYKLRAECELIHARWRNWNLVRFTVRGLHKVKAVVLWHALANNVLQGARLMRTAGACPATS